MVDETSLGMAQRHVRESTARIARQRVLIERLRAFQWNVEAAENTLRQFEELHVLYRKHLQELMQRNVLTPGR